MVVVNAGGERRMKAFRVMGRTIKSGYDELFLIVAISVVWWLGAVLIVTAPLATVGLQNVANRIANYKRVDMSFFWEGARTRIGQGVLLFVVCLLAPPLLWFSVQFYFMRGGWVVLLGVTMAWVLLFALMMGQYLFPFFWQQTERGLLLMLRNSLVLAIRHPLYTLLMLLFQLVLIVLSIVLVVPVVLLLPGLLALAQNHAVVGLLQDMGLAPEPPVVSGT
jgi:hypothetical protein